METCKKRDRPLQQSGGAVHPSEVDQAKPDLDPGENATDEGHLACQETPKNFSLAIGGIQRSLEVGTRANREVSGE